MIFVEQNISGHSIWIKIEQHDDSFDLADRLIKYACSYLGDHHEDRLNFNLIVSGLNYILEGKYNEESTRLNRMIDFAIRVFHGVRIDTNGLDRIEDFDLALVKQRPSKTKPPDLSGRGLKSSTILTT